MVGSKINIFQGAGIKMIKMMLKIAKTSQNAKEEATKGQEMQYFHAKIDKRLLDIMVENTSDSSG